MAFTKQNFQALGGQAKRGVAPQHFSYATLDSAATVDSSGYFNDMYHLLEPGDVIHRVTWSTAIGSGGTVSNYGTHLVLSKSAGVIDVSDETNLTETDTD